MTGQARALLLDATVSVDLDPAHLVDTDECQRPEWAITDHGGVGRPATSTTPAPRLPVSGHKGPGGQRRAEGPGGA